MSGTIVDPMWGRKDLAGLFGVRTPAARDLLPDYREETRLAAALRAHAPLVAYPFLRVELERLAAETDAHAEALAGLLRAEGIDPLPADDAQISRHPLAIRNLDEDMNALKRRIARYRNLANRAPRPLGDLVGRILADKLRHEATLVAVVVRIVR